MKKIRSTATTVALTAGMLALLTQAAWAGVAWK